MAATHGSSEPLLSLMLASLGRRGDIHGPNPYKFIGIGDIHGPKPYKFIGFGDIHGPKPYKFIGFGDIHGPNTYAFIRFGEDSEDGDTRKHRRSLESFGTWPR